MRRREFIAGLGSAAVAQPLAAEAQQPAMPVIGYLGTGSPDLSAELLGAFRQGLRDTGYEDGRNVRIEYRWADGQYDRLPSLAADLVRQQVRVLVTTGALLLRWPQRLRQQQSRLSFRSVETRSRSGWSQASIGRAAISRAPPH
jgi:hypothetical protein